MCMFDNELHYPIVHISHMAVTIIIASSALNDALPVASMWKCYVEDDSDAPSSPKRRILEQEVPSFLKEAEASARLKGGRRVREIGGDEVCRSKNESHGRAPWAYGRNAVEDESGALSVTIEPEVLDCSVCWEPLAPPVFQCENGHTACSSCCSNLKNRCHICSVPIGCTRCIAIEKVIESIKISCRNSSYGCREILTYPQKLVHEESCMYAPCMCPIPGCSFLGSSKQLVLHLSIYHELSVTQFCYNCPFELSFHVRESCRILRAEDELLFTVSNRADILGNAISLASIKPPKQNDEFAFYIMTREGGRSLSLKSFTMGIAGVDFLMVPCGFSSSEQLKFDVCIWHATEVKRSGGNVVS